MKKNVTAPLYKKLLEDLKTQLDAGMYKVGDLLPSENDLCKSYNTTRPTVRQALSELSAMGYIVRHHGKGSMVSEPKQGLGILSIKGFTAGIGEKTLRTEILQKPIKMAWPSAFYDELSAVEKEAGCIFFSRIRVVNNLPILFEETYITDYQLPRFISRNLENKSLFKMLSDHYHVEVKEGKQKIWAVSSNKNVSDLLKINLNSPVLHMKRRLKTNIKDLVIYSHIYCNTENYFLEDGF